MTCAETLDERIKGLASCYSKDELILVGGLAVYLATDVARNTDDIDVIVLDREAAGRKMFDYQMDSGVRVDSAFPDNVFDSLDLSNVNLRMKATRTKLYETGEEVSYLCPEALIVMKLTSFCSSGDPSQPTRYGIKVLRDKDLNDIRNLLRLDINLSLMLDLLETVPQIEEIDQGLFYDNSLKVIAEANAPVSFVKNAFGIGKLLAIDDVQDKSGVYTRLLETSRIYDTPTFGLKLDYLYNQAVQDGTLNVKDIN
ncbi:hypothetical protein COV17_03895 [Candidatus Woesearchaeota archaeon CG10_big_fil_rev_8_21_14_0_10_36_11]|nr:MAG: hypothetical protein COV17_03895 [Candidatus Woesearchaeota archaeon CG10_big_fil_rev_8_21_14_0_10_36_11]